MGQGFHLFRGRVGVAIVGAILVGGIAAVLGAGSVWHPAALPVGGVAQGSSTATAAPQSTNASTATPTVPSAPSPTTPPTAAPTATRTIVGSSLRGTVVSVTPAAHRLVMSNNGVPYTILVDDNTNYSGTATQLSGIQRGWHISATIKAREGNSYLASAIYTTPDD